MSYKEVIEIIDLQAKLGMNRNSSFDREEGHPQVTTRDAIRFNLILKKLERGEINLKEFENISPDKQRG